MDQPLSLELLARRKRHRLLILCASAFALTMLAWGLNRAIRPGISLKEVATDVVRPGSIANTISASGVVLPTHEEQLTSPIQTRIAKVHAKAGQSVTPGELLLTLDDHAAALAAESLKEQLAQQENKINGLGLELEHKGRQIASVIELLELDLQAARVKWEGFQAYKASGAIAKNDLLAAELNVRRAEIQVRQQHELIADHRRSTDSALEAARLQKNILSKQLHQQQQLLAQTQVRAPFAGMLSWLQADEGASITQGQLVARVSELNNFGVEASLSDFHARALSTGQVVRVEHSGQVLPGRVQNVLPEIQNGTVKMLIALEQPNHPVLRHKLRVDVNIVTDQKANTLVVSSGAAFNGKGEQPVYLIRDGVARKTLVNLGASDGKQVEILTGALAGDRLITSDMTRHKDHERLRVTE